jgi:murein DD-endopeptidase MepM/ murein hydrolase activator NlpD
VPLRNRLVRLLGATAFSAFAIVASTVATSNMLVHELGGPTAKPAPSVARMECASFERIYTNARFSNLGVLANLGRPGLCTCEETHAGPFMTLAGSARRPVAPAQVVPVAARSELSVVHARIGAGGSVRTVGPQTVRVQLDVLRIIARELAFPRQLRVGTPLELVYETGRGAPRLVAMRIGRGVAARNAFYFRSQTAGNEGFFSRDGKSLEHRFLRYPLAFDRVSSGFTAKRYHPILRTVRPHNGVDFAARPGTAVISIGSGRVVSAAWSGRYGRTVEVEHEGGYTSRYSHLQRFAASVRTGSQVRKGQIIGYVGTSGLTTGPHLHFALTKNDVFVDPLGSTLPKRSALEPASLSEFRTAVARIDRALASANEFPKAQIATHPRIDPRG